MAIDGNEEAWIGLREHAHVSGHRRTQRVAEDSGRSVALVEPHIVEGRGILRPNHCAGYIGHDVGEVGPGVDLSHPRGVELRAGFVGEPREQAMVG